VNTALLVPSFVIIENCELVWPLFKFTPATSQSGCVPLYVTASCVHDCNCAIPSAQAPEVHALKVTSNCTVTSVESTPDTVL